MNISVLWTAIKAMDSKGIKGEDDIVIRTLIKTLDFWADFIIIIIFLYREKRKNLRMNKGI